FFQAEDGIRDDLVTGVQTCALPISPPCGGEVAARRAASKAGEGVLGCPNPSLHSTPRIAVPRLTPTHFRVTDLIRTGCWNWWVRSEERRVGQECRSWGARYGRKKKT